MVKIEELEVFGWRGALRGMRNALNSWDKSDSFFTDIECESGCDCSCCRHVRGCEKIGPNDLFLMQRLAKGGTEHRKYLRMIHVQFDLTADHTFYSQFDTYKVGVTRNSCSKMHTITYHPLTIEDFSINQNTDIIELQRKINRINLMIEEYNDNPDKDLFDRIVDELPLNFMLKSTIDMNYENALNMYFQRNTHKRKDWKDYCDYLYYELPYLSDLIDYIKDK